MDFNTKWLWIFGTLSFFIVVSLVLCVVHICKLYDLLFRLDKCLVDYMEQNDQLTLQCKNCDISFAIGMNSRGICPSCGTLN